MCLETPEKVSLSGADTQSLITHNTVIALGLSLPHVHEYINVWVNRQVRRGSSVYY